MSSHWDRIEAALSLPGLSSTDRLVLVVLAHHVNGRTLKCRVGSARLIQMTGLSRAAVFASLARLVKAKAISRKRTGRSTIYYWSVSWTSEVQQVDFRGPADGLQRSTRCTSTEPVSKPVFNRGGNGARGPRNQAPPDFIDLISGHLSGDA